MRASQAPKAGGFGGGGGGGGGGGRGRGGAVRSSPFDRIAPRQHHAVLNRKVKGAVRATTEASERAVKRRQEMLKQQLEASDKANVFEDRRIGARAEEAGGEGDEERVALARFQRERRQRLRKASRFNLDAPEEVLTHAGAPIGALGRNDGPRLVDEGEGAGAGAGEGAGEEDDEALDPTLLLGSGDGTRSKFEVLQELIRKSKLEKAERAKLREEREAMLDELDEGFDQLRSLLTLRMTQQPPGGEAKAAVALRTAQKEKDGAGAKAADEDDYALTVQTLAAEARAAAQERRKTPEEAAAEEKQRLEALERARQRRMQGIVEPDVVAAATTMGASRFKRQRLREKDEKDRAAKRQRKAREEGDDSELDGNYEKDSAFHQARDSEEEDEEDEENANAREAGPGSRHEVGGGRFAVKDDEEKATLDARLGLEEEEEEEEEQEQEEEEEEEEEDEDEEDEEEEEDGDGDDEDDLRDDTQVAAPEEDEDEEEEEEEDAESPAQKPPQSAPLTDAERARAAAELPFTFAMPRTYRAFAQIVRGRPGTEHALAAQRIVACHHVALAPENAALLDRFFGICLEHHARLCDAAAQAAARDEEGGAGAEARARWADAEAFVPALFDFAQVAPRSAAKACRERLLEVHRGVMRRVAAGVAVPLAAGDALFFKLLSLLFPVSDLRHNVVTPALLLLELLLARLPVRSARDAGVGLWLSRVALFFVSEAGRLVPVTLAFLAQLLRSGAGLARGARPEQRLLPAAFAPQYDDALAAGLWAPLLQGGSAAAEAAAGDPAPPLDLLALLGAAPDAAALRKSHARESLLRLTLRTASDAAQQFTALPSAPEISRSLAAALSELAPRLRSASLRAEAEAVLDSLLERAAATERARQPLSDESRPKELRTLEPLLEDELPQQIKDAERSRRDLQKLQRRVAREKKGAQKELRRSTQALEQLRRQQQAQADAERDRSRRELMTELQQQARDSNVWSRNSRQVKRKNRRA